MAQYGKGDYWNERYTREPEPFDWYQRYDGLSVLLKSLVQPSDSILMVGCGNSRLSEDMYSDGYKNITNMDISHVVIFSMQEKCKDFPGMSWKVMDVTAMNEFPGGSFDAVVDKGTLDALLCGEGSSANSERMCLEVSRVLKSGGRFVCVTYGEPSTRLHFLDKSRFSWSLEVYTLEKPKLGTSTPHPPSKPVLLEPTAYHDATDEVHYIYVATKQ
eukprot:TRINITY_DN966_c0_g1_i2.p1 TRINITY_DN966_c0_g1~~TRINITY_DN966_c0_g1_i2.p1  ORF type:complete len:216 (+),score=34.40 TRINITY_DN966_c0_g1_i2:347-994(+)